MTGNELRAGREAAGLTVAALSRRAGVGRETIHRIEAGAVEKVRTDTAAKLRRALELDDEPLTIGEDPRTRLLRLFDTMPGAAQSWLIATAEFAAAGFGRAHEPAVACRPVTRGKAPAAGPLAPDTEFGPELRPRQVPLFEQTGS